MKTVLVFGRFCSNVQVKWLTNVEIKWRPVAGKTKKEPSKIKCQSKHHQTICSNRVDLAFLALQTFMFDCPSHVKKLSTDGEKLRLTISNCSQLLLTDWLCPTVESMCFTPLELNSLQQIAPLTLLCMYWGLLQLWTADLKASNLTTEPQLILNLKKVTGIIRCPVFEGYIMRVI